MKVSRSVKASRTSVLASTHLHPAVVDSTGDTEILGDHVFSHVCALVLQLTG